MINDDENRGHSCRLEDDCQSEKPSCLRNQKHRDTEEAQRKTKLIQIVHSYRTLSRVNPHAGAVTASLGRTPVVIACRTSSIGNSPRPTASSVPAIERTM